MPFANECGTVAIYLKDARKRGEGRIEFGKVIANSMRVHIAPRQQTGATRRAQGRCDECIPEVDSSLEQAIHIWGVPFQPRVAQRSDEVVPVIVDKDKNDVPAS
jgi:hypothetical protein